MTARIHSFLALLLVSNLAHAGPPDSAYFEKHVRPLLAARCVSCHGPEGKAKGGLRLDTPTAIRRGGESGPVLEAGKPDRSLLIQAVRFSDERRMPPKGKLPASEIAILEAWVQRGAVMPAPDAESAPARSDAQKKRVSDHWAFQPVREPAVPSASEGGLSPIDRFLNAKLQTRGIRPAPPADRRTLLRRVTFGLTGLPPTAQEMEAFLADPRPDAFARVVDRLLASPAYGERWGRHWLDVARYADSNGMDENLVQANAWRFRDHVLARFNEDLPFDRFLVEQLAGDLLPGATPDNLVATGFLALGPKMLAEDDPVKMQMDIIDEQIDTIGKAFLGLTLGCSRCHDHKFDPFPTTDYYALAGIFKSTKVMENYRVVARWFERPLGTPADLARLESHRQAIEAVRKTLSRRIESANAKLLADARARTAEYVEAARAFEQVRHLLRDRKPFMDSNPRPTGTILVEAENYTRGNVRKESTGYGEKIGVIYNAGPLPNVAEYDLEIPKAGAYQVELRFAAAESRPVVLRLNGAVVQSEAATAVTGTWYPDSQRWTVEGIHVLKAGKNTLRLERAGPFPHFDKLALIPRETPPSGARPVPMTSEQFAQARGLVPLFLTRWADHLEKSPRLDSRALDALRDDAKGPFALPKDPERFYPAPVRDEVGSLRAKMESMTRATPVLPEALGATEGPVTNVRVHLRGNHLTLGPEVPRRFPVVLVRGSMPTLDSRQSGRRELAEWMARAEHPLTARVLVNRVWHWHFGAGLVRSPDNFGLLGDRPTHPELLDWLARRFVVDGWSIKALHRRILFTDAYQRGSTWDEAAHRLDPENRLHGRFGRRRLDAESYRDALLAVGGGLDRTMGGTLFEGKNRGYVPGYPNGVYDRYDYPRRSVYLPVIRSMLYDVFQAFDFADPSAPSGERAETTVAPQALFALNGSLMGQQSLRIAQSLLALQTSEDSARVEQAYRQALGRLPTPVESARALAFLSRAEQEWARQKLAPAQGRERAWQGLCRALLASNEFVYLD